MLPDADSLATPLAYALAYALRGWHVLPLEPGAKIPLGRLVPRGMLDASTDSDVIRGWWRAAPSAGIGIAMAPSGLVALDVDPRNGGVETFDSLQADHGSLVSNVMALTGGGGQHHVFLIPPGAHVSLPGTLGPGLDVKANGYIVVEPSVHPNGLRYEWESSSNPLDGVAPSVLPDWLRNLRVAPAPRDVLAGPVPVDAEQARDAREALWCLDADDRDTWMRAGMALHSTQWGHAAFAIWCSWSQQSDKFTPADQRRVWESFRVDRDSALTLAWVFARAGESGWANPRRRPVPLHPEPDNGPDPEPPAGEDSGKRIEVLSLAQLREHARSVSWIVKGVIPGDSIGVVFGGSGTFKSFIALDLALHIAHGMQWLGRKTRKGPVLIVAAEGGTGLWRRIEAWHIEHGLCWQDAEVYVVPIAIDLARDAMGVFSAATDLGVVPAMVVIDTLSQTFSGEENSAADMAAYMRELGAVFRDAWSCAVLAIHHTGHQATERPRGSSAIRANVDFLIGVFRDETEMLATVCFVKQKDGELHPDEMFKMSVCDVGTDDDGDKLTSLMASRVITCDQIKEVMDHEAKSGRGGRNQLLLSKAQAGMAEKELRQIFYEACDSDSTDGRRQAYHRALSWAKKTGFIEVVDGFVLLTKRD